MAPVQSVREFYKDRSVLVTGGTGFMGKVLIEKLLYSIPKIGDVYVLIRPKRGKSADQRLEELQRLPVFDRLRKKRPIALQKIQVVQGDVRFEGFGLSRLDTLKISDVSVVFHCAATLRLEAPLKEAVDMNTAGTLRAINVARKLKNIAAFVHLSTAFCCPDREILDENVYSTTMHPKKVIKLTEWLNHRQLELLTPTLLGRHPNCYTFSKRLAETFVEEAYPNLPITVVRPSIVCPAYLEPMPGWVDSLNGPVGVMLGAGKGVIRTMLCDGSCPVQVIPVDIAANAIIAIGMIEGTRTQRPDRIPVYNLNAGHKVPTTWGEVLNIGREYGRRAPLEWPLWYPNGDITTNVTKHELKRIFYHLLPAYCIDALLYILGQKRFMVRVQKRISQGLEVLQFFTMRSWHFDCLNFESIQTKLEGQERKIFNTDASDINRVRYMIDSIEGGRVYCLKEDPKKVPINKAYHDFLYVLDWGFKILFCLFLVACLAWLCEPFKSALQLAEPLIKYLPFLGSVVRRS